jgi:hypothetical protein
MAKRRRLPQGGEAPQGTPSTGQPQRQEQYKIGITWNPLPAGVESMRARLTAMYSDTTRDSLKDSLNIILKRAGQEAPELLSPNKCWVIVRTALAHLAFQEIDEIERFADGRSANRGTPSAVIKVEPHDATFERRFSEPDATLRLDRALTTTERIRNCLAFSAGVPLPVVSVLKSANFLLPVTMDCPAERYAPAEPKDLQTLQPSWHDALDAAYAFTQRLMDGFPPEDPVARAVSLVGEAIWTSDFEERFFYAWRALEVVGNFDLKEVRRRVEQGDVDAAMPYLRRNVLALLDLKEVRVDPLQKVAFSISTRAGDVSPNPAEEYYDLRNAIAHGDVSGDQHAKILRASPEITRLAHRLVSQLVNPRLGVDAVGSANGG